MTTQLIEKEDRVSTTFNQSDTGKVIKTERGVDFYHITILFDDGGVATLPEYQVALKKKATLLFKEGDRVRHLENGQTGTVLEKNMKYKSYKVDWDATCFKSWTSEENLEKER